MSNCSKISELLSAYIDNEITAKEKELVEKHLSECTSCKQKLGIMLKTKDILKSAPPIPVPETLLKDFEEYRKKSEQTEKKVVPFYKNYRIYASVAAIFLFAFVLKSGLWQEDKFVPDTLTQTKVTEQTIDAPAVNDTENTPSEDSSVTEKKTATVNKKAVATQPAEQPKPAEQAEASGESATIVHPATTQVVKARVTPEIPVDQAEHAPSVAEASVEQESPDSVAAYDETQSASPMARTMDMPRESTEDNEAEAAEHAIVYVSKEHLAKAAKLLAEGDYFYAQVEQKLNDNRIPFESNYLSLDESVPHKVVVMVKE